MIDVGSQLATGFNVEHKIDFACVNLKQRYLLGTCDHISENDKWEMFWMIHKCLCLKLRNMWDIL